MLVRAWSRRLGVLARHSDETKVDFSPFRIGHLDRHMVSYISLHYLRICKA